MVAYPEFTREQIQALSDAELRSILRSTKPTSERLACKLAWAFEEMKRRYAARARRRSAA